jgi:DASS family divalent anion:Na+ symporter
MSAAAASPPAPKKGLQLQPVKVKEALVSIAVGLAIRFLVPCPEGVTMQAWTLLSIFISTIAGIVLNPLPVGAWAFFGLTTTVFSNTLTFQQAFGAFTNDVIWLIVIIFFIARGFVKTGLGDRAGYLFAKVRGSHKQQL